MGCQKQPIPLVHTIAMTDDILHRTRVGRFKCLGLGLFCIVIGVVAPLIVHANRDPRLPLSFRDAVTLYACPAMFIPMAILYLRKLVDPLSGLIITTEGIINNSGFGRSQYAKFNEISAISIKLDAGRNTMIYVYTEQPGGFASVKTPRWIRIFMSAKRAERGVRAIVIIGNTLEGSIDKTIEALRKHVPCPIVDER